MNGRIWHGRVIQCQNWDGKFSCFAFFSYENLIGLVLGKTKYNVEASTEAERQRIDEWHRYLNEDDEENTA